MEDIEYQPLLEHIERKISRLEKLLMFFTTLVIVGVVCFFIYLFWKRNDE